MKTIKAVCVYNGDKGSQMSEEFEVGSTYKFDLESTYELRTGKYTYNYRNKDDSFTESLFNKYFKVGHPHAELMAKAAEIAKTDCEWWKHFEYKSITGEWKEKSDTPFLSEREYRLKPKTITIGKYEVPEPVSKPLNKGDSYFVASPNLWYVYEYKWYNDRDDFRMLNAGMIHLTKEAAEIHSKALIQWTMKDE